jgi:hypothetical protein
LYGNRPHTDSSSGANAGRIADPGRFTDPVPLVGSSGLAAN